MYSRSRLLEIAGEAGADDAGVVELSRPALADERTHAEGALPGARALLGFVVRLNREPIRTPARSVANLEFHHTGDHVNEIGRAIVQRLEREGVRALNPSMGFPMEMDRFPDRLWVVAHKVVAEQAGLGRMGIHRNVIHPRFGNFILLGTVVLATDVDGYDKPLDYNPCLECKLCVAACPVGAIGSDGHFDFSACYTHNYREFMGGFTDWVEGVAESRSAAGYRSRTNDSESASMWQSLSFGANYKAAYCMSVCPAGDDVIAPYREGRAGFLAQVVKPLQQKEEPVYVVPGSDAEAHVEKRYPHKTARRVRGSLRPKSARAFLRNMGLVFQRGQAGDLDATYHFDFDGGEVQGTVTIRDGALTVQPGLVGEADTTVKADGATWVGYLAGEKSLVWALLRRRIRVRGSLGKLRAFDRCFPR